MECDLRQGFFCENLQPCFVEKVGAITSIYSHFLEIINNLVIDDQNDFLVDFYSIKNWLPDKRDVAEQHYLFISNNIPQKDRRVFEFIMNEAMNEEAMNEEA
ncbi:unnamed protein product [Meloidogyne enterolobii]|uniref:Uncharacterized protein n=1 Tax=Meloidogyne enterolobii TaxID=390850 RepID=A0ACB1B2Y3_MELEN